MNDRFRFRAWGKQDKELIYEAENTYDCQSYNGHTIWHDNFACLLDDEERYTVEQCTGLKDKKGRLIYEGDIVESTIATRNNKPARDVIKYNNEFAGFEPMCLYDCDCDIYNPSDELVIVGNVHENPELLEDK